MPADPIEPAPLDWPQRLHHKTPGWVSRGAIFHIRISQTQNSGMALTSAAIAEPLSASVLHYQEMQV